MQLPVQGGGGGGGGSGGGTTQGVYWTSQSVPLPDGAEHGQLAVQPLLCRCQPQLPPIGSQTQQHPAVQPEGTGVVVVVLQSQVVVGSLVVVGSGVVVLVQATVGSTSPVVQNVQVQSPSDSPQNDG